MMLRPLIYTIVFRAMDLLSLPIPVSALCEALWLNDAKDPEAPDATKIVVYKKPGDNHAYIRTNTVTEYIVTSGTGGGHGEFSSLTIDGKMSDALLIQRANLAELLRCDTDTLATYTTCTTTMNDGLSLDGYISAETSQVLDIENNMIGLASEQKTVDDLVTGWYSEFSNDAGATTMYRGVMLSPNPPTLYYADNLTNEPTEDSPAGLQGGSAHCGQLTLRAAEEQIVFGPNNSRVRLTCEIPAALAYTLTIPNAGADAEFVMLEATQNIAGTKSMTAGVTTPGPVIAGLFDYQIIPLAAYNNTTNPNSANMAANIPRTSNAATNIPAVGEMVRFGSVTSGGGVLQWGYVPVRLRQGTYSLTFLWRTQSNHGIMQFFCTALGVTGNMDGYSASVNIAGLNVPITVPTAGVYDFGLRQNGKNPSSSDFLIDMWPFATLVQTS